MTTTRCETVRDALPAFVRGELDVAEEARVREHLAGCADCSDALGVIETLAAARVTAPATLADRVNARLAERTQRRAGVARPMRWLAATGLAAAAVVAALLAWPSDDGAERALELPPAVAGTDPFLDEELFGETTPAEAELDGMIRVAAADDESLPDQIALADPAVDDDPPIALDVGSPLGDWPGSDGITAGAASLEDLTYEELELLLTEMET